MNAHFDETGEFPVPFGTVTQVPDDGQRIRPRTGDANAANCVTPRRADSCGDGGQSCAEATS